MAISVEDREIVDSFLSYVEGEFDGDERYGSSERFTSDGDSVVGVRFPVGQHCWIVAAILTGTPGVRVAFATNDQSTLDELLTLVEESEETPSSCTEKAFAEAGLKWEEPPVERFDSEGLYCIGTMLNMEALADLDFEFTKVKSKVPRMVEGFMIAFGSNIAMEDDGEPA